MFENKDLPSISAFPKGETAWRIDWFGEIAFPDRMMRRTQPSVLVHLSRVIDESYRATPSVLLNPASTTPAQFQRKIWVSVGTLCILRVGDIWRNQELEFQPDYELETFENVRVDETTTTLVKAGLSPDADAFLLPSAEHPWHMNCTHSYCVTVDIDDKRSLVVPCIELIRFYFGSSSSLITKLFLPPLERKSLCSRFEFNEKLGRLTLNLAAKISGKSAADIGRLQMDPLAWRAAVQVGTSLLKGAVSLGASYPKSSFPFNGDTTLTASGKWLSFGDRERATFVVFSLRSCSHPFPFRSLNYRLTSGPETENHRNGDVEAAGVTPITRRRSSESKDRTLRENDASDRLSWKQLVIRDSLRFPDLAKKTILKSRQIATGVVSKSVGQMPAAVNDMAVGEPGSMKRIRPVELSVALERGERKPVPEFAREVVDQLKAIPGLAVELLTDSDEDGWTVPMHVLSDSDGECDMAFFIEDEPMKFRTRRVTSLVARRAGTVLSISVVEADHPWISYREIGMGVDPLEHLLLALADEFLATPKGNRFCQLKSLGAPPSLIKLCIGTHVVGASKRAAGTLGSGAADRLAGDESRLRSRHAGGFGVQPFGQVGRKSH